MDIYKLYASVTTSTDAAASLDITVDGWIVGYLADMSVTGADALNDGGTVEVSFGSTSGMGTNDTKASILTMRAAQGFLTSGGSSVAKTVAQTGLAIAVTSGERMYIHTSVQGTATLVATVYIYVMPERGASERPSPRRRL